MNIFSKEPGKVFVLEDGAPGYIKIDGWDSVRSVSACIMEIFLAAEGRYHFVPTLSNDTYIYIFGDKMAQLSVRGLAFSKQCTNAQDPGQQKDGLAGIVEYYKKHRISTRNDPVSIVIGNGRQQSGGVSLSGWLLGMSVGTADAESGMHRFNLEFQANPL